MIAKRILACTDFSAGGNAAAAYAVELAAELHADVVLTHLLNGAVMLQWELLRPATPAELEGRRMVGLARLQELARQLARPGVSIRCRCEHGDPHRDIPRLAQEEAIDLIVVGRYGHSGLARLFLGSVADSVIRNCTVPVLAISNGGASARAVPPTVAPPEPRA
jgi:nucleotide-binding universal stress UspA family protein